MIYLIGGSPRVGKSIIAKQFAENIKGKFVSTDELDTSDISSPRVIFYDNPKKNIIVPSQRIEFVKNEAERIIPAIDNIISQSLENSKDTIIEGVHLFPSYVDKFIKKFGRDNLTVIFICSTNIELVIEGMVKNTGSNNWSKEFNQEVLEQIATFTKFFSDYLCQECKRYNLLYKERSNDFQKDILEIIKNLKS